MQPDSPSLLLEVQLQSLRKYRTEVETWTFKKSTGSPVLLTGNKAQPPHTTFPAEAGKLIGTQPKCSMRSHIITSLTALIYVTDSKGEFYILLLTFPSSDCSLHLAVICLDF